MKTTLLPLSFAVILLASCASPYETSRYGTLPPLPSASNPPVMQPETAPFRLAPEHWDQVAKIRAEALRLNALVGSSQLTKVQAAQHLDKFRLKLVGNNFIDDNVYKVYLRAVVESQAGKISTEQSKQIISAALSAWQQSWLKMDKKPTNPAFTNFLMQTMKMTPLK